MRVTSTPQAPCEPGAPVGPAARTLAVGGRPVSPLPFLAAGGWTRQFAATLRVAVGGAQGRSMTDLGRGPPNGHRDTKGRVRTRLLGARRRAHSSRKGR